MKGLSLKENLHDVIEYSIQSLNIRMTGLIFNEVLSIAIFINWQNIFLAHYFVEISATNDTLD